MKKVFKTIIDIIATLFAATVMAVTMCITYVVLLPVAAILESLMNKQHLSTSWLELHKAFISYIHEA